MFRLLFLLLATGSVGQSADPLPEKNEFLQEVRKKLHTDEALLSQYTYTERSTVLELDKNGKIKKTHLNAWEVYPSADEESTYRKRIVREGKTLGPAELEKQERERAKQDEERLRKLERESSDEKTKRLAKAAARDRKEEETIEDVFQAYQIEFVGRRFVDGQPAIELTFEPRPGYKAKTREARILGKLRGRAWFGEKDHELVNLEANLIDDISFGMGLLAKLDKGAQMVFRRRRVNDEIWLPAEARFTGKGRVLLLKSLRIDAKQEFSDYRKFTVETSVKYSTEK